MSESEPLGALAGLSEVSTSTLATVLFEKGYRQQFLVGLTNFGGAERMVGEAFTMRLVPSRRDLGDETGTDAFREVVDTVEPGRVIVVDSMGDPNAASLGDLMATRLAYRGVAGYITDGAIRDAAALGTKPLVVRAGSISATTRKAFFHLAGIDEVVACAGVTVVPGDIVVGDEDGVLVIPRKVAAELLEEARRRERFETFVAAKLEAGAALKGNYPPDQRTRDEYEEWERATAGLQSEEQIGLRP